MTLLIIFTITEKIFLCSLIVLGHKKKEERSAPFFLAYTAKISLFYRPAKCQKVFEKYYLRKTAGARRPDKGRLHKKMLFHIRKHEKNE